MDNHMEFSQYEDRRGWKYKVLPGIGGNCFKARYQKPDKSGEDSWHGVTALPWRDSSKQAQEDLDAYAAKKGWVKIIRTGP